MKKLLAIGLAAAALAAAPAFASSPPPTATAGPPTLAANNDATNVDYKLHYKDLVAADKMAGYSLHLRVTASDARSPLGTASLIAVDRPGAGIGEKALAQKKTGADGIAFAKKLGNYGADLLAASAGHPGIGIAWAQAPAANTAKTIAVMVAGEKYAMNATADTIRASPSITLKI